MWGAVMGYVVVVGLTCLGLALAFNWHGFARWYARKGNSLFFQPESRFDENLSRIFGAVFAIVGPIFGVLLTYALVHGG